MKRLIAIAVCIVLLMIFLITPISALYIYKNGVVVGESVLTSKNNSRVYHLEVVDYDGSDAYGAIYLYDSNGNMIDGGWSGYYHSVTLEKGDPTRPVTYKTIRSSVQGVSYDYYYEYP